MTENPLLDVHGVEAQMPPDLQERDPSLGDKSPHKAFADTKSLRNVAHVDQLFVSHSHNRHTGLRATICG